MALVTLAIGGFGYAPVEWHEVPYRDQARQVDRSLGSIRLPDGELLDLRLLSTLIAAEGRVRF